MNHKGKFITFEGGEGSGKTTQSKMLFEYLKSAGKDVIWTREPGGCHNSEKIRSLMLNNNFSTEANLLMVMAARSEHLNQVIIPALIEGKWVICDRFIDSTCVYQGIVGRYGVEKIIDLHDKIFNKLYPDITFFMDIKPEEAIKRISNRDNNILDNMPINFHNEIYNAFIFLSNIFKERFYIIDAKQEMDSIKNKIINIVNKN